MITKKLSAAIQEELTKGKKCFYKMQVESSTYHFERAHVLGQSSPYYHVISHWWMLKVAILDKSYRGVIGQFFRILLGFIGSLIGCVPLGNTGGVDVSPFKSMAIPEDLQVIIDNSRV